MIKNIKIKNIINRHFLVFDLDGTIVDTDIANFLAYKDAIQQIIGLEIPISYSKYGRFTRENLLSVIDNLTNLQYKNIIDMKNILYKKYLPTTKVNSSLIKIINKYINTNKIILATNSYRDRAEVVLHHHGLNNIFDHMFLKKITKRRINFFMLQIISMLMPTV